jgi:hypothetical protein
MRILSTFDRVITEVLGEKVRARLTFKVFSFLRRAKAGYEAETVYR